MKTFEKLEVGYKFYFLFYFMANIFAVRGSPSGYFNIFAIRPVRLSLLQLLLHPLRFSFLSPC